MPRTKWRTVSCLNDSLRSHGSQLGAYGWISGQRAGARFRVQYDKGRGWQDDAKVVSNGDGTTEEE
jgi:hypothetical protein